MEGLRCMREWVWYEEWTKKWSEDERVHLEERERKCVWFERKDKKKKRRKEEKRKNQGKRNIKSRFLKRYSNNRSFSCDVIKIIKSKL